jgi:hypothetical protein
MGTYGRLPEQLVKPVFQSMHAQAASSLVYCTKFYTLRHTPSVIKIGHPLICWWKSPFVSGTTRLVHSFDHSFHCCVIGWLLPPFLTVPFVPFPLCLNPR